MGYIYLFKNEENEVIYVGHTRNFEKRMISHFGNAGHLPKECYEEVHMIHFAKLTSLNEARMYELYYIGRLKPKYNTVFNEDGFVSIELPQPNFEIAVPNTKNKISEEFLKVTKISLDALERKLNSLEQIIKTISIVAPLKSEQFSKKSNLSTTDLSLIECSNKVISHNKNRFEKEMNELRTIINSFKCNLDSKQNNT